VEHLGAFFLSLVDRAGYPGLFLVMLLGNIGIPVGTELVVPTAGALVGMGHLSNVWLAGAIATAGEVVGAGILYAVGFYGGRPFVERWGKYMGLSLHKLDIASAFYDKHGRKTVFICRFIPVIRGIASLPAGISRMRKRYFFPYTAAGSAGFCFGLMLLGLTFSKHFDDLAPYVHKLSLGIVALGVIAVAFVIVRLKEHRAEG